MNSLRAFALPPRAPQPKTGKQRSTLLHQFALFLLLACFVPRARASDDWLPITPEELHMTSEPKAPGVPAIYLYRQSDRDDLLSTEYLYVRIKIFSEEGRKYANIEIPYFKGIGNIKNIQARTIHPDGSIFNFDGKVSESTIVKAKGVKVLAKTFTLPNVEAGSIVEYRYTTFMEYLPTPEWLLSEDLFTRRAKFSYHFTGGSAFQWGWPVGLPPGTKPPTNDHNTVRLETQDVPAFEAEEHMPPSHEMRYRIEFTFIAGHETDPEKFWKVRDQIEFKGVETFTDKRKAMEQAVSQIISPGDSPQAKLEKIYKRVLGIHNSSYEREKTTQENKREKTPDINTVEDVWKHSYGNSFAINWLFLALAKAAGMEASPVLLATREERFFNRQRMNARLLNSNLIVAKVDGKDIYLDPGTPFAPFGTLPWYKTDTQGLRLEKEVGTWIVTPQVPATETRIERNANLRLTEDQSLEGKITVTYVGMEALWRRLYEYDDDEQSRKKFLEDELKEFIPTNFEAELANKPDWGAAAPTLVAEFTVKIPGWVSAAGHRTLFSAGLFGGSDKHVFEHAFRVYPIYFSYPYQNVDDVTVTMPEGMQVRSAPAPVNMDFKACSFDSEAKSSKDSFHLTRRLQMNLGSADAKFYGPLRDFFQRIRTADETPVVLEKTASTANNENSSSKCFERARLPAAPSQYQKSRAL